MSESSTHKRINQRYPGTNGKLLRGQVDSDFVIESNRKLRFLDANGKPLLRAHDLNERNQGVVIEEYVAGILEHGLIADVRSKPICIPSKSQYDDAQNRTILAAIEARAIPLEAWLLQRWRWAWRPRGLVEGREGQDGEGRQDGQGREDRKSC